MALGRCSILRKSFRLGRLRAGVAVVYASPMSSRDRTALVTGGGRGIGEAIARRLVSDGVRVHIAGRSTERLQALAEAIGATPWTVDLCERSITDAFVAELLDSEPVDILVNNAGVAASAPLHRVDDESWDRHLEINATAPFRLVRALAPAMIERGWGRVVNIASNAGVSGYRYTAAYCASKHAVVGLTRALATDFAKTGVTINAVCPGWVNTDMVAQATSRIADKTGTSAEEARTRLASMSPQGRIIEPAEVAHVVAMLCADEARGVNGQALVVDGGQVLK